MSDQRAVHHLVPAVQHYPWGHLTFIPTLLGVEPDGLPWAELWLGTHPNGPTRLDDGRPLGDITGPLPYLLKVLAAGHPLSLQTHPNGAQAAAGYAVGRYPDPSAKPELLCALTPFVALCGMRPPDQTLSVLDAVGVDGPLASTLAAEGIGAALTGLYRGTIEPGPVIEACRARDEPEARWVVELDARYPGEPSVAVTLLMNLVELQPDEWITLEAGVLHAYLSGAGVELMSASDNVVRGGLTTKPVDVDDLLAVVDPTPLAKPVHPPCARLDLPGTSTCLHRVAGRGTHLATGHELAVTTAGDAWHLEPGDTLDVDTGTTAYVAAAADR